MDQEEYINALKPIEASELTGANSDLEAPFVLAKLFLSLLMALAYTLLTRCDLCVYVIHLQRYAQKPKISHIRMLNVLVKWAKKHSLRLIYRRMVCVRTYGLRLQQGA